MALRLSQTTTWECTTLKCHFRCHVSTHIPRRRVKNSKVWVNKTQYFADVPDVSWSFYIGGYHPAQKWLKDRKKSQLSFDDIVHYQKIIKILAETDRIMRTIELDLGD